MTGKYRTCVLKYTIHSTHLELECGTEGRLMEVGYSRLSEDVLDMFHSTIETLIIHLSVLSRDLILYAPARGLWQVNRVRRVHRHELHVDI